MASQVEQTQWVLFLHLEFSLSGPDQGEKNFKIFLVTLAFSKESKSCKNYVNMFSLKNNPIGHLCKQLVIADNYISLRLDPDAAMVRENEVKWL